jgi:hypothetical protein
MDAVGMTSNDGEGEPGATEGKRGRLPLVGTVMIAKVSSAQVRRVEPSCTSNTGVLGIFDGHLGRH